MTTDPTDPRAELAERARQAGYVLARDPKRADAWVLSDAEDGELIYSTTTLDRIERWLDE